MKKILLSLAIVALLVSSINIVSKTKAQEDVQVSPREWVLGSSGVEVIDVHIAVSLALVDRESVEVSVVGVEDYEGVVVPVEDMSIGADRRGDLVIKFVPNLDEATVPEEFDSLIGATLAVRISGRLIDGNVIDESFEGIGVKDTPVTNISVSSKSR